jgi:ABC-type transport system substrate-binding protein
VLHRIALAVVSEWYQNRGFTSPVTSQLAPRSPFYNPLHQPQRLAPLLAAAEELLEEAGASVYNYYKPDRSLYE